MIFSHIEIMLRDAEITKVYEGSNGIQRIDVIRQTMGFDPMGM